MLVALTALSSPVWAQSPALVERGMKVFANSKCSMCHSIAGKGNPKGALDNITATSKAEHIRQWLQDPEGMRAKTNATRTPAMKPAKLTPEQIDALVAFLMSVKPVKAPAGTDR